MAYDPVKAHEYYINYRKKGLKKGRKKAAVKPKYSTAFLGVSARGFNDEGRIQVALTRERLKKEMKAALGNAKTDEERQQIRLDYSRKAQQAINALKADSKYATSKNTSSKKSTTRTAGEKANKSKNSNNRSRGKGAKITRNKTKAQTSSKGAKVKKAKKETTPETTKQAKILKKNEYHSPAKVIQKTEVKEKYESTGALLQKLETLANTTSLANATQEQKFVIKDLVNSIIGKLQTQMNSGDVTKIKELIENLGL